MLGKSPSNFFFIEYFSARCRFHCPKCSNNWASAKATAILYYPHAGAQLREVCLRLYGQQCKKCLHRGNQFADPEFEEESIKKMLSQLYERVECDYYGKRRPPRKTKERPSPERVMKGPHEKHLCEACQRGHCTEVRSVLFSKR